MRNLKEKINESVSNEFVSQVQNEIGKEGGYQTFNISNGKKKYKKGFICFNEDNEFVSFMAYNSIEEYREFMNLNEEDFFKDIDKLKVHESFNHNHSESGPETYLRIW